MPQEFLVRRSDKEGVLRSIGELPNGIIGLQIGEGEATWTVNFKRQPPEQRGTIEVDEITPEGAEAEADPIDVPKLVAGCESQQELFSLAGILISSTQVVIGNAAPERDFPTIRAAVDLLEETLMAVEEAVRLRGEA